MESGTCKCFFSHIAGQVDRKSVKFAEVLHEGSSVIKDGSCCMPLRIES